MYPVNDVDYCVELRVWDWMLYQGNSWLGFFAYGLGRKKKGGRSDLMKGCRGKIDFPRRPPTYLHFVPSSISFYFRATYCDPGDR